MMAKPISADNSRGRQRPLELAREINTAVRGAYIGVGLLSAVLNVFMIFGSLFMLQIYDRVMPSGSIPTLVGLLILMVFVYLVLGVIETIRTRTLARIGERVDEVLAGRALEAVLLLPLRSTGTNARGEPMRPTQDLERIRSFLGSQGPAALADLPWMPFYLGLAFLFHPQLGLLALAGIVILVFLTVLNEWRARAPSLDLARVSARRSILQEAGSRNAETIAALGMRGTFLKRVEAEGQAQRLAGRVGADVSAFYGGLTKTIRQILQSSSLALGAYLALNNEISSGTIIAVSIITSRTMAPVEQVIGQWKGFVAARQSWARLKETLAQVAREPQRTPLPRPQQSMLVRGLAIHAPGSSIALVRDVSFSAKAGEAIGVIGPSGAGKSSLARALVGAWLPGKGEIRLDGADLAHWPPDVIGQHVGYLPQGVDLFDGTVAENIARLAEAPNMDAVLEAARRARAHDLILKLPMGYDTRVGLGGITLSAGQRQRVGLARALYGNPFLLVLDEPNANLDAEGDEALSHAINDAKAEGAVVVVIAHRPSAISACDHVLVIAEGRQTAFGPKEEILKRATVQPIRQVAP